MKNIKYIITGLLLSGFLISCSEDFLEYEPEGVLSNENVATAENAESLVIAAYAGIANDDMIGPLTHMWVYGSVRSDDSYKGGGGRSDVGEVDRYEQYYLTVPDQGELMAPSRNFAFIPSSNESNTAVIEHQIVSPPTLGTC